LSMNTPQANLEHVSASDRLAIVLFSLAGAMALVLCLVDKTPLTISLTLASIFGFLVYPILHFFRRIIYRIIGFVVAIALIAYLDCATWPKDPFAVEVGPIVERVNMWEANDRASILPIRMAVYVRLINEQRTSTVVNSINVEGDLNDEWVPIYRVDTQYGDLYMGQKLDDLNGIKMKLLDQQLRDHNLQSGDNAVGWMLFFVKDEVHFSRFRFSVKDINGVQWSGVAGMASNNDKGIDGWVGYRILTTHNNLTGEEGVLNFV
jgi:hypothetical protein